MRIRTLLVALAMLASTGAAMANCYEDLGCDDSQYFTRSDMRHVQCKALWELRNAIYAQNGYCFQTQRGIDFFGNKGCWVTDQAAVSLNAYERENVATIRTAERAKGCD